MMIEFIIITSVMFVGLGGAIILVLLRSDNGIRNVTRRIQNVEQTNRTFIEDSKGETDEITNAILDKVKIVVNEAIENQRQEIEARFQTDDIPLMAKRAVVKLEEEMKLLKNFDEKPAKERAKILRDVLNRYDEDELKNLFGFDVRAKKESLFYDKKRFEKFMKK